MTPTHIKLYCTPTLKRELESAAAREGCSVSRFISDIILRHLGHTSTSPTPDGEIKFFDNDDAG